MAYFCIADISKSIECDRQTLRCINLFFLLLLFCLQETVSALLFFPRKPGFRFLLSICISNPYCPCLFRLLSLMGKLICITFANIAAAPKFLIRDEFCGFADPKMASSNFSSFDLEKFKEIWGKKDKAGVRADIIAMAKHAEHAERYEDMCHFMRELVNVADSPLVVDERNLLSVAYKNVIGARRASWRTLNMDEKKDEPLTAEYRRQVEAEMTNICNDVLELLKKVVEGTSEKEERVFYLKMTGDYYRYLAEFTTGEKELSQSKDNAAKYYKDALNIATDTLKATHPIRLGLALNYSVCQYEILKNKKEACALARRAFDDAIQKLDTLDENSYKDSTLIMQLLRDNLTLWTSDQETEEGEAES